MRFKLRPQEAKKIRENNLKKSQVGVAAGNTSSFANATQESSRKGRFQLLRGFFTPKNLDDQKPMKTNQVKEYFDNLEKRKRRLDFSEWRYCKSVINWLLCRKDPEEQLARKARDQITKDLDIIKVFEKLKEIDKLKAVLLNHHQREVFSFIERPVISLKSEEPINKNNHIEADHFQRHSTPRKTNFISKDEHDSMEKYNKLYSSYRYLVTQPDGPESRHNKKLVKMIGEDLLKVFKKVDQAMGDRIDPRQFEVTLKKLMDRNGLLDGETTVFLNLSVTQEINRLGA